MKTTPYPISRPITFKISWSPPITWTEVGLWLLILYGAFLGTLKRYAPIPSEFVTLGFDALCFGLLTYKIIKRILHSRRIPYSPITIPLLLFMGFALLTILNPHLSSLNQGFLGWRFLASGMAFHFLGFYAFDDVQRMRRFFVFFWSIAGIVALYGVVQLVRGYTAVELAWIDNLSATMQIAGTGRYRLMATMGGAVDLGLFMALSLTSLVGYMILNRRITIIKTILFGLILVAIVFTYVRAAWAAVFVGVLYLLLVQLWHKKRLRPLFPILAVLLLIIAIFLPLAASNIASNFENPALQERVASLSNPLSDASMLDRFQRWSDIWLLVQKYPLGIGVGMTGATALRYPETVGLANVTMDNSYLKVLIETGWFGLGLFILLLLTILVKGNYLYKKLNKRFRVDALPLLACFVAFIVILVFGEYIEINPGRTIIWVFTGFLFSLPRLQRIEERRESTA